MTLEILPEVAERLGYYVYLYVDPRTGKPFYVGKGRGSRALAHLMSSAGESRKAQILTELERERKQPRIEILAHALPSEETALRIEAAIIDLLGLDQLANLVSGWQSIQLGRISVEELTFYYAAKPIDIGDPVLLIRIKRLYRHDMPPEDLYDATRGIWSISPRRAGARYALAVFEGVVREVYEIEAWHPGGTTTAQSAVHRPPFPSDRWEFTGRLASEPVRSRYRGGSVRKYLRKGLRSPIVYVNC